MTAREKVTPLVQPVRELQRDAVLQEPGPYQPPFRMVLASLGLTEQSLLSGTITLPVPALLSLLSDAFAMAKVDEAWYRERYPDVHAAILAGRTPSAASHFHAAGYREGRLPAALPFDPDFYFDTYQDLGAVFERGDSAGLRRHYETQGYLEGRAGVAQHFQAARSWAELLSRD